jgi:predicted aspartyl protease
LPKVIGSVDELRRPLVRVTLVGQDDDVLATIDTGFNGELMATLGDAIALGVTMETSSETVQLGDNATANVSLGRAKLSLLGKNRNATVFVSATNAVATGPKLLIGTRLLTPHLLLIDFEANTVEIETQ